MVDGPDGHEQHNGAAEPCEVLEFVLAERHVSGQHGEGAADLAVRHGHTGFGGDGDGARHARDDGDRHPGCTAREHFLAAPAEDERVTPFESHDPKPLTRVLEHESFDVVLRNCMVTWGLADVDQLGARRQLGDVRAGPEPVVQDDVRVCEGPTTSDRDEVGVARPAPTRVTWPRGVGATGASVASIAPMARAEATIASRWAWSPAAQITRSGRTGAR